MDRIRHILSWIMLIIGVVGFFITFPLWLLNVIDNRMMIGITLALSWAALWYEAFNALQISHDARKDD